MIKSLKNIKKESKDNIKIIHIDKEIDNIINTIQDDFKLSKMDNKICDETNNILDKLKNDITNITIKNSNIDNNINFIIYKIKNNSSFYLDSNKIHNELLESIKLIIKNNSIVMKNKCPDCNIDMGRNANRRLCGKTKCYNLGQKKIS
jgi:hypothetical protein